DLRAAVPWLHVSRPRDGEHKRTYVGVGLVGPDNIAVDRGPRGPEDLDDADGPRGPRTGPVLSQAHGLDMSLPANDDGWPDDGPPLTWEAFDWSPGGTA